MKKIILTSLFLAIVFSAFTALADNRPGPAFRPLGTPKIERNNDDSGKIQKDQKKQEREQKEVQKRRCLLRRNEAKMALESAVKKAKRDYQIAIQKTKSDWRSSDKGDLVKQARRTAEKAAQDAFATARETANDAWKMAVEAHNQCVRNNASSDSAASAMPTPTIAPVNQ